MQAWLLQIYNEKILKVQKNIFQYLLFIYEKNVLLDNKIVSFLGNYEFLKKIFPNNWEINSQGNNFLNNP